MKYFSKFIKNQRGVSLIYTIMIVSLALGALGYVTTEMLPKLHSEKKKAESTINYRVFISSLNDYLIHGIRERWCLSMNGDVTDLLLSNECGSGKSMEHIVTYPGNLERVLWGPENIGTPLSGPPSPESANRILALNYVRFHSNPKKADRLLGYDDIYPPEGKLKFKVTQAILNDMTDQHPLYLIAKNVRECIDQVNIEIFQIKDYNLINAGDERKIGIHISTEISRTKFSCLVMRTAESTSYYTFYPRRLHTFSLMKYGNLDGTAFNEFHGPVYVAGDFVLPPESFDKENGSVFYGPLVLGMYNEGGASGKFHSGRLVNSDKSDYTFESRGHPYLSKQDNYPNFRGFLGGINLDASEDKGFHNLFDHTSTTSADTATLEACIEETKVHTTPSVNNNSDLVYHNFNSGNTNSLRMAFTKKNRFKLMSDSPKVITPNEKKKLFTLDIPEISGNSALGSMTIIHGNEIKDQDDNDSFTALMGVGGVATLGINLKTFDLRKDDINEQIEAVKNAKRNNYKEAINFNHIYYNLYERQKFREAGDELKEECEDMDSKDCNFWGYSGDCGNFICDNHVKSEIEEYIERKDKLVKKLEDLRDELYPVDPSNNPPKYPEIIITMSHIEPEKGKIVLNQKDMFFTYSDQWINYYPLIKNKIGEQEFFFQFVANHFGNRFSAITLKIPADKNADMRLYKEEWSMFKGGRYWEDLLSLKTDNWSWYKTKDNDQIDSDQNPTKIIELDCPTGMGIADWDLDMSGSTNFAWNYANTPPGAQVDTPNHDPIEKIVFDLPTDPEQSILEGHASSYTKSIVKECVIPKNRTHVYGFYVCDKLVIEGGRSVPLYMIGTFIVNELVQASGSTVPVFWHNIWDTKATDLVMTDVNSSKSACSNTAALMNYTWKDLKASSSILARMNACSPMDMVANGPNNFSWTTIDPDIGLAGPTDVMTSQKVNRIQKWAIREDSRTDMIR